jgi:hypothetical protein
MSVPVNSRVTPALDPSTYLAVEGVNDSTRGYISDVVSFANDAYSTLGQLWAAKDLVDSNLAWGPEQKVLMMTSEVNKQKARLAQKLDRTMSDLESRIEQTEGELLKPVQQGAAVGPLASEVRAHCKALDNAGRSALIREALSANDESTLQAVLGAQPFLSGMSAVDSSYFIRLYHENKQPHLVERLDVMKRVRDSLNNSGANGAAFHSAFAKVVGATPSEARAIEMANQRAVAALNIQPTA